MAEIIQTKLWHWLGAAVLAAVLTVMPKGCTPLPAKMMPSETVPGDAAAAAAAWQAAYGGMSEEEAMKGIVYEPVPQ